MLTDGAVQQLSGREFQSLGAAILAWSESNTASLVKQLVSGEIVFMHMSKPKANTLNICYDVFVCNCQFVMTFNAGITVIMNRLALL